MSPHFSALCSLVLFKQFLLVRCSANMHFLEFAKIYTLQYSMYKLLNNIRKSEFMDSNLLQCDAVVAVAQRAMASIGP